MEISAPVAAIGLATAAGAVAWVAFTLLPDVWRAARIPVVVVASIMGALNGFHHFRGQSAAQVERQLLSSGDFAPLAQAWKAEEPSSFAAFVASISEASRDRDGGGIEAARVGLAEAARARMAYLPDARLAEYLGVQSEIFGDLERRGPSFCRSIFFGEPLDGSPPVNDSLSRRQIQIFADTFRSDRNGEPAMLVGEAYEVALAEVTENTFDLVGDDLHLLQQGADIAGQEANFCRAASELFRQMAASPQAGPLYRAMLAR
jgi:hypothetical protein